MTSPGARTAAGREDHNRVLLEPLEPRYLLSADLFPVDMAALGEDDLTLALNGTNLQVIDTLGNVLDEQAAADTSRVVVTGGDAQNDRLTIDFSNEFFIDIAFDGLGGDDSLVITGGTFDSVDYAASGPDAGSVIIADNDGVSSTTITYSGLEPITDTSTAAHRTFTGTNAGEQIRLTDPDSITGGQSRIDSNGTGAFESITFANPTDSLTIDGAGGDDTIFVEALDADFDAAITLDGGDDNDILTGSAGDDTLIGGAGDDTYVFAGDWGDDTIVEAADAGFDVLDFTGHTGALGINADRSEITSGTNVVRQGGVEAEQAEALDVTLDANARDALVTNGLAELAARAGELEDFDGLDFASALALLSQNQVDADGNDNKVPVSLGDALDLSDVFDQLGARIDDFFGGADTTLSGLAAHLAAWNASIAHVEDDNSPLEGLGNLVAAARGATLDYGGDGDLDVSIDFDFRAERSTDFDLDLGSEAELIGLSVTASVATTAALDGGLRLGLTAPLSGPTFFTENVAGSELSATIDGSATINGAEVNFGFLTANVDAPGGAGPSVEFAGELDLALDDGDGRLTAAELAGGASVDNLFDVTARADVDKDPELPGNQPIRTDLPVTPLAGVALAGGAALADGRIDLAFQSGLTVFSEVAPTVTATNGQGVDLLDFSNTTPNEVLPLLDQVFGALQDLAASEALAVEIPLAGGKTIGDVLDFAARFETAVLDALVQGDADDPDRDAAGNAILLFQGAQQLASLLPGVVEAVYDPNTKELTFAIDIGTDVVGSGRATVRTDQAAGGGSNEQQSVTIEAVGGDFRLGFRNPATGETAFTAPIAFDADAATVETRLEALPGLVDATVARDGNVYEIEFVEVEIDDGTGTIIAAAEVDVDDLIVDATDLEGGLPVDFDFDLGDLVSVQSDSLLRVSAEAGLSLVFGISLEASEEVVVAPPVFKPADGMGGDEAPIADGKLSGTATFELALFDKGAIILDTNGDPTFEDDKELIPAREPATEIARFTIALDADAGNETAADLAAQLQDAIDLALFTEGQNERLDKNLGFTEALSLTAGGDAVTASKDAPAGGQLDNDVRFSLSVNGGARILGTLAADDTGDNTELAELAQQLQDAINAALGVAAAVTVGTDTDGNKLTISADSALDVRFFVSDIVAEAANGRISLSALPVMVPVEALTADQAPNGGAGEFAPGGDASFTLVVNPTFDGGGNRTGGDEHTVTVTQADTAGNTTLQQLVDDLQAALVAAGIDDIARARASQDGRLELTAVDPADTLRIELDTVDVATVEQPRDEVQTLDLRGAVGGSYRLLFDDGAGGSTPTADIAFNASAEQVSDALEALAAIGEGNVSVTRSGSIYRITFTGDLGSQDLGGANAGPLSLDATDLVTLPDGLVRPADTQPLATQDGFTADEVQSITVNPADGTFTLSFGGETTAPIDVAATAAEVQAALTALSGIGQNVGGDDNVSVDRSGDVFTVTFVNDLANTNVETLVAATPAEELGFIDGLDSAGATPENVDRRIEIGVSPGEPAGTLIFDDPAFQELGLLSSPVSFDGVLTADAHFTLVIDGTAHEITVAVGDYGSVAGLVDEINASINLAVTGDRATEAPVQAFRLTEDGNRFAFEGEGGSVERLQLQAPDDARDAAITELGLSQEFSGTERAKAGRFFLEDVALTAGVTLDVSQIEASATLGFIGVSLESDPAHDNELSIDASLTLLDNDDDPDTDGRVLIATLTDGLAAGDFDELVDASVTGFLDVGFILTAEAGFGTPLGSGSVALTLGTSVDPINLLAPDLADIAVAVNAGDFDPFNALTFDDVLAALNAVVDYLAQLDGAEDSAGDIGSALVSGLTEPLPLINKSIGDLLASAREFADFVGAVEDRGASSVQALEQLLKEQLGLAPNLPFQLSRDAVFTVEADGTERHVTLLQSVTEDNSDLADLAADLDEALQLAFAGAGVALVRARTNDDGDKLELFAEDESTGTELASAELAIDLGSVEVETLQEGDSGSDTDEVQRVTVNATGGNYTLNFGIAETAAIAFDAGADEVKAALVEIPGLTEDNIEVARNDNVYTITFIDQDDVGELVADPTGLVDATASAELGFDDSQTGTGTLTAANAPAGEQVLELDFGLGAEAVLRFDFDFGFGARASLPFDLDLAAVADGNPELELFASLVGVDATGNLAVELAASLELALGLSLSTDDGVSAFLFTGDDGTRLSVDAAITGEDLDFNASIASFTVGVEGGSGSLDGSVEVTLDEAIGERFGLEQARDFALENLQVATGGSANLVLPLFVGGEPVAGDGSDGANELRIEVASLADFFVDPGDVIVAGLDEVVDPVPAVIIRTPDIDLLEQVFGLGAVPSLFEILSDPAVVVDGMDSLLRTLQDALNGEVLGISLPLIGEALGPAAQVIEDFRSDLLRPLGDKLREELPDPPEQLRQLLFDVFGPQFLGGLGLLLDEDGNQSASLDDIRRSGFILDENDEADFMQFDFTIGQTFVFGEDIGFNFDDLPAIGLELDADLELEIAWSLDFGFGIDERNGFYFVTEDADELSLTVEVDFGDNASASGQLGFLAVDINDGITVDDNGTPDDTSDDIVEHTRLFLDFAIDLLDPGENDDRLGFAELISAPFSDLIDVRAVGGADLRLDAEVNFGGLGLPGPLLPSIGTEILLDWDLQAGLTSGFEFGDPEVAFNNIEVDLGSFITEFAAPILDELNALIEPLDFLIGPSGLLNLRLPVISDLAGSTVTIKTLAEFLDSEGKIVPFLNAAEEILFLADLVTDAAAEANQSGANIVLSFGDLDLNSLLDAGESLKGLKDLKGLDAPDKPSGTKPGAKKSPDDLSPGPSKTFTKSVTRGEGSFNIELFKPENIFKLLLGQGDVTLFTYALPPLGFNFTYRQEFPVFGPLVAFLGGSIEAGVELTVGYDTRGLEQFQATGNVANVINGFFISDVDQNGVDVREAYIIGEIFAGGGISIGVAKGGVEGGIGVTIEFNLNDPDRDTKVRLGEIAANIVANATSDNPALVVASPISFFDVSGMFEAFLRAFVEVNLLVTKFSAELELARITLFEFDIPFERVSSLAQKEGSTLVLNVGDSAEMRYQGNTDDIGETIFVKSDGDAIKVWSPQFNVPEALAQTFLGIDKIVASSGAGNDVIDLSRMTNASVATEIRGGAGRDRLIGGAGHNMLFGEGGDDTLIGGTGGDLLDGGAGNDVLRGNAGDDELLGGAGNDRLLGGLGNDFLDGGIGDDRLDGDVGDDVYVIGTAGGFDRVTEGSGGFDRFDLSDAAQGVRFLLDDGTVTAFVPGNGGEVAIGQMDLDVVDMIIGTRFADTFEIHEGGDSSHLITLDGGGASDKYTAFAAGLGADAFVDMNVSIRDTGNSWDNDAAFAVGTDDADRMVVTDQSVTFHHDFDSNGTIDGVQTFAYNARPVSPDDAQPGVESLEVDTGEAGDDISVLSTPASVSVRLVTGAGDDRIHVGDGAVGGDGLNEIKGQAIFGPLVIEAGSGQDTLIIDDSPDATASTPPTELGLRTVLDDDGNVIGQQTVFTPSALTATDAPSDFVLSGDATFTLSVNGSTHDVTLLAANTDGGNGAGQPGGGAANATLADLVNDVNFALFQAGLEGIAAARVSEDATRIELYAVNLSDELVVSGLNAAAAGLGFTEGQESVFAPAALTADEVAGAAGENAFVLGGDAVFTIDINGGESAGGITRDVVLKQSSTENNRTLEDLVDDLNEVFTLPTIGLDDFVRAEINGDRIALVALDDPDDTLAISFDTGDDVNTRDDPASELGFDNGQSDAGTMVATSVPDGTKRFVLDNDVSFTLSLPANLIAGAAPGAFDLAGDAAFTLNVSGTDFDVSLAADETTDNESLAALVEDLNNAFDDAGVRDFVRAKIIGDRIAINAVDAGDDVTIGAGAEALGFAAGQVSTGGPQQLVTLFKDNTNGANRDGVFGGLRNVSLADLADDVTRAIAANPALAGVVEARIAGDRIELFAVNQVDEFTLDFLDGRLDERSVEDALGNAFDQATVTGLGLGEGLEFSAFENVELRLGVGHDRFTLGEVSEGEDPDAIRELRLFGGPGEDRIDVAESLATDILLVSGGTGDDIVTLQGTQAGSDPLVFGTTILGEDVSVATLVQGTPDGAGASEVQQVTIGQTSGFFTLTYRSIISGFVFEEETAPIPVGADAALVQERLEALQDLEGNVSVSGGDNVYTVSFINDLADSEVAELATGDDVINILGIDKPASVKGGGGSDAINVNFSVDAETGERIEENNVNALLRLDGQSGGDSFDINLAGSAPPGFLIEVIDTGNADSGADILTVNATEGDDDFLLRAGAGGLAFVAMLNTDFIRGEGFGDRPGDDIERVNYDRSIESLVINSLGGDDFFTLDDNAASTTINSGAGNDVFQVGQLFNSRRDSEQVGISPEDFFATIETTRGFLSNGISEATTINAGAGEDDITVFHNLAVLNLHGGDGDDTFTIRAFALAGSQDDLRERTDVSGDAGADLIQYAVNAPVNIDGGDGLDIVKVIGTEFGDDFVITEDGVFGAGLNVNFVGIESLQVDGAEGDDRFFILSTDEDISTEIIGGKGSDTFIVSGPTPSVISDDLLGHSGIISHTAQSEDDGFDGVKIDGLSVNIADDDEPGIVITQSGGYSRVSEGGSVTDSYTVVLTRRPEEGKTVTVTAIAPVPPPEGEGAATLEFIGQPALDAGQNGAAAQITFGEADWFVPKEITFQAIDDDVTEGLSFGVINHTVRSEAPAIEGAAESIDGTSLVDTDAFDGNLVGRSVVLTGRLGEGQSRVIVDNTDDTLTLADPFDIDEIQTVEVTGATGGSFTLTFDGQTTGEIAFDASAAEVQAALQDLSNIALDSNPNDDVNDGGVAVTSEFITGGLRYTVRFQNDLGSQDVAAMTADGSGLADGSVTAVTAAASDYRIGITDAFVGLPTGVEGTSFTDTNASFPTENEGLRGAEIEITSGPGVGQKRLIESNTGDTLTLFKPWDPGAQPEPGVSTYKIERYDGLAIPSVTVEIIDDEAAGVVITQSDGGTSVIETDATDTFGAVDSYQVALTRPPAAGEVVAVTVTAGAQLVFADADGAVLLDGEGNPLRELTLTFDSADPQTVFVRAAQDGVTEGFHHGLITHAIDQGATTDADFLDVEIASIVADVADDEAGGVLVTETNGSTDVIEGEALPTIEGAIGNFPDLPADTAELAARSVLVGEFEGDFAGKQITITDGPGEGQTREILANSDTVLLLDQPWDEGDVPDGTSAYSIFEPAEILDGTITSSFTEFRTISYQVPFLFFFRFFFITRTASVPTSDVLRGDFGDEDLTGKTIQITSGPGAGESRTILSNTARQVVTSPWSTRPGLGSEFEIVVEPGEEVASGSPATDQASGAFAIGDFGDNPLAGATIAVEQVGDGGALVLQEREILANTSTVLLIEGDWDTQPDAGNDFTITAGVPFTDTYTVVLTREPDAPVTVQVNSEPTRATRGQVVNFFEQVHVEGALETELVFDESNWNIPQTVVVTAIDDLKVDGGDTQVFAPMLEVASRIQGPLFIEGGFVDEDVSDLTQFDPVRLPGETNVTGELEENAVDVDSGTVTVRARDIANFAPDLTGFTFRFVREDGSEVGPFTIESHAPASVPTAEDRLDDLIELQLGGGGELPEDAVQYIVNRSNPNFFVNEEDMVDALFVHHTDSLADDTGALTDLDDGRFNLSGLGMGGDTRIAGHDFFGGISFESLEELFVNLGDGDDTFTFDTTFTGATTLDTGRGDDTINVEAIGGHTFVNAGAGSDVVNVGQGGLLGMIRGLLTLSGDVAETNVTNVATGSPSRGAVEGVDATQRVDIDATGGHFSLELLRKLIELEAVNEGEEITITFEDGDPAGQLGFDAGDSADGVLTAEHLPDGQGLFGMQLTADAEITITVGGTSATIVLPSGNTDGSNQDAGTGGGRANTSIEDLVEDLNNAIAASDLDGLIAARVRTDSARTADLDFDADEEEVRDALETALAAAGLVPEGTENVTVLRDGSGYIVTFTNDLGERDMPLLIAHDLGLTSGLGQNDVLNVDDSANLLAASGLLTSTTLTGLGLPAVNEIQTIVLDATGGSFTLAFEGETTTSIAFDAPATGAGSIQQALEALPNLADGDVSVTRNDDVIVVRFQGDRTNADVAELVVDGSDLVRDVEQAGGAVVTEAGSAGVFTRIDGSDAAPRNDAQSLTVDATGGSYTLTLRFRLPDGDGGTTLETRTTDPIAFDASADTVRRALQVVVADTLAEEFRNDVSVDRYGNDYIVRFQGKLREIVNEGETGLGVRFLEVDTTALAGSVELATRMDGVNYYGFETVNIAAGTDPDDQADVFNIQGTTAGSRGFFENASLNNGIAVTNVDLGAGDERIYVSSRADLDGFSATAFGGFDFLTGDLDDVNGALNLDTGAGRHGLFISDEGTDVGDDDIVITDTAGNVPGGDPAARGLNGNGEIFVTGLAGRPGLFPEGGISYRAAPEGNFHDGIVYWTGAGDDTVTIDGTHVRQTPAIGDADRTMTLLNTGLGDDRVTVDLHEGEDGFFALHTMGGAATPSPVDEDIAASDDDTVRAGTSTLPLIVFGGLGNDDITGGHNEDILFGDFGRVQYLDDSGDIAATLGFGGHGDRLSSEVFDPDRAHDPIWVISRDTLPGGVDTLRGGGDDDILIGGGGSSDSSFDDYIDGNADDDLIFGDNAEIKRRPGEIANPRFQALLGGVIYSRDGGDEAGAALVDGIAQDYRNADGDFDALGIDPDDIVPAWAEYEIVELFHDAATEALGRAGGAYGHDYIAGGAGHDQIFGQLGDDVIQGDGSIESALDAENPAAVGATRAISDGLRGTLDLTPSFDAATDGDDYIEGNGGGDVVFGNLGQDDIIGGSSSLFTLVDPGQRPDGSDLLFGGSGTAIDRNDPGVPGDGTAEGDRHARDADVIAGDNANIYRIVGTNEVDGGGFLGFNYDNYGELKIIARAVELLDYTPGGIDFDSDSAATDIGSDDEIHGESGDDFLYGMTGSDVLFGEGQDDDLIGGYGHDWISGGTGDDGVLGDDGRIFTSRNGTAEPLHDIEATTPSEISTPGNAQTATIHVDGELKKTVDLTPFYLNGDPDDPLYQPLGEADDIIYGGLGNDFLHGGAGDDAISGAEALAESWVEVFAGGDVEAAAEIPVSYDRPNNPGNVLGFGTFDPEEFAAYDEDNPLQKILVEGGEFFLNFDATEGPDDPHAVDAGFDPVPTDGDDRIFGDLGNDWLVGGTGRDNLYGGWGNDLHNADDDLETNGGLNDEPDTHPSYEDRAFGGAGRDVLIANTGGDRLIDWLGEFNSYLVPFSPFGAFTVSRNVAPALPEFLYDLSASDGADPTRAADVEGADPARNGEPFGELGLVLQQDDAWGDQRGAPGDPQPGNGSGNRDVLRSSGGNGGGGGGDTGGTSTLTTTDSGGTSTQQDSSGTRVFDESRGTFLSTGDARWLASIDAASGGTDDPYATDDDLVAEEHSNDTADPVLLVAEEEDVQETEAERAHPSNLKPGLAKKAAGQLVDWSSRFRDFRA